MKFCVIRHPEISVPGTCPETAYAHQRALGWVRVSEWRDEPSAFHLPHFADAIEDLDPGFGAEPAASEQESTDSQPDTAEQTQPAPKSAANKKEKTA